MKFAAFQNLIYTLWLNPFAINSNSLNSQMRFLDLKTQDCILIS